MSLEQLPDQNEPRVDGGLVLGDPQKADTRRAPDALPEALKFVPCALARPSRRRTSAKLPRSWRPSSPRRTRPSIALFTTPRRPTLCGSFGMEPIGE